MPDEPTGGQGEGAHQQVPERSVEIPPRIESDLSKPNDNAASDNKDRCDETTNELVRVEKAQLKINTRLVKITAIAVVASIVSVVVTTWLSQRNARIDQRAWVTVSSVYFERVIAINEAPKIAMILSNSGKTPALDVQIVGQCGYGTSPPAAISRDDPTKGVSTPSVIGPGEKMTTRPHSQVPVLSAEVVQALRNSSIRFFIKGWISYRDIFGKAHMTTFCFAVDGKEMDELLMETCETTTAD